MNRTFGIISDYAAVRQDASRIIIGYDLQAADEGHYTWNEVYFYKKQTPNPSLEQVKEAVVRDINEATKQKIIEGFVWNGHKVWLSSENQFNYKSAFDMAVQTGGESLPETFKFGTDEVPDYVTFETVSELRNFWTAARNHIKQSLADGWAFKDGIDWRVYESGLESLSEEGGDEP